MDKNKSSLVQLALHEIKGTVPSADFTLEDVKLTIKEELVAIAGTYQLYRKNKIAVFELIEELYDILLPARIMAILGMFADVETFAQGQKAIYKIKKGRVRGKQFVTRVAPSGVYETFRLDEDTFEVTPKAHGGAGIIDFERFLDGKEDIGEIMDIILEGLEDVIYKDVQKALLGSWSAANRPSVNKVTTAGFDADEMTKLVNIVSAYGKPVIFTTPQFAAEMTNALDYDAANPNIPAQDLIDIREQGYIGKFKGTAVVVLPQSFEDETNTKFSINPRVAYVIPAGKEKLVKVAFEGDTIVSDWTNKDNSYEIQAYKKFGVAIISAPNFWGIYQNTAIEGSGWDLLA
jgi:hypothetical protein